MAQFRSTAGLVALPDGEIFLVSKVMPQHATRRGTMTSCDDLAELDDAFPPPARKIPLEMI